MTIGALAQLRAARRTSYPFTPGIATSDTTTSTSRAQNLDRVEPGSSFDRREAGELRGVGEKRANFGFVIDHENGRRRWRFDHDVTPQDHGS